MGRRHDEAAEHERQVAELEAVRPFLALAREIKEQVELATSDDSTDVASLVDAVDAVPRSERSRMARAAFDRLLPDQQWAVLERSFGDEEIREYLTAEREARLEHVRRTAGQHAAALAARQASRLDLSVLSVDEELTLGLFLADDVRAAVARGRSSTVCARQLVLRTTQEAGVLHVVEDVFNPRRGLFVTAEYDEQTWATERLEDHARVRLGSLTDDPVRVLQPLLYPGGRVDVEHDGEVREGRLHLGFAVVGDEDVFAAAT